MPSSICDQPGGVTHEIRGSVRSIQPRMVELVLPDNMRSSWDQLVDTGEFDHPDAVIFQERSDQSVQ